MKAYELIEKVKKGASAAQIESEMLYEALSSIESRIGHKAELPKKELDKDDVLYACGGGVADGYTDMYSAYLDREACRIREDWDCFNIHDAIFNARYEELCKEIIRNRKPKRYSFK
jgi:hypothetical protein